VAGDAICAKWIPRYAADRPHLTGAAANVPLLVVYGTNDTTITPDRATCGFERLRADMTKLSICVVPGQTHLTVVGAQSGYVNDWIASNALGGAAPAKCALDDTALKDDAGTQVICSTPPPND
jgi:pimeloyl-ACP methyl ester carboxylesterase